MENRKNFFGKYTNEIDEIHYPLMSKVISKLNLNIGAGEYNKIQCNFSEYLEHHPEEPNYFFEEYNLQFQEYSKPFLFAFNNHFFKSQHAVKDIIESINKNWTTYAEAKINHVGSQKNIYSINISEYGMMQTIHYLYPQKELVKDKIDYQIFKVIYPYDTLKPLLNEWDT